MTAVADPTESRLLNRELSSLEFYARVLELAEDGTLPLLERVKFAAIFAQFIDEFFMIRVAGLLELDESEVPIRSVDGLAPSAALAAIRTRVNELAVRQARLWKRELRPGLAAAGIEITTVDECSEGELSKLGRYFERDIYPILTPLAAVPASRSRTSRVSRSRSA